MKKLITILMCILILPVVTAQEEVTAGVGPDSMFYSLDLWFDEISVRFAKLDTEKAKLRIELAEERGLEIEDMANKNKIGAMEIAREEHTRNINEIDKLTDNMHDAAKIQVQERLQKHIMTLERVAGMVPESAQEGIANTLENSRKAFERNQIKIAVTNRPNVDEIRERVLAGEIQIREPIHNREILENTRTNVIHEPTDESQTINQIRTEPSKSLIGGK